MLHAHGPQRFPDPCLRVGHHRLAGFFFDAFDDGNGAPLVARHIHAVDVRMLTQQSGGQVMAGFRRKRPDHVGIRTAQAAKCHNLDAVVGEKANQPLVLVFGKR